MTTIQFGGYQPERSVHTQAGRDFGARLSQRLGDAIDFHIEPDIAASGRPAADLLALTESGENHVCYFASSYLTKRVPELALLDLAFADSDRARVFTKLDGEVGRRLESAVAARTGYDLLAFWDNGIRHVSNVVRPIRHPRDCVGLSIRTLDNRYHQAMFAALGFEPRFIDVKDLAAAVTSRAIDAQENPLTNVINFAIQKTHRHLSLLGQFSGIALLLANRRVRAGWPGDVRAAVDEAAIASTQLQRRLAADEDQRCLAQLIADGVDIVPAADIDLEAFKHAVSDVTDREAANIDKQLLALWRA